VLGRGWEWQWDRVLWRLEDVRAVYAGREGGTDSAVDAVQSFFEVVHHLKDWLRNDKSSGVKKAGESLIKQNHSLRLCADLANGSKHFLLTSTRTGDLSTTIGRNDVTVSLGTGKSAHRFYVQSAGAEYDVLKIAEEAVDVWTKFLSARGLL
jgi:hypothetical protein